LAECTLAIGTRLTGVAQRAALRSTNWQRDAQIGDMNRRIRILGWILERYIASDGLNVGAGISIRAAEDGFSASVVERQTLCADRAAPG
jgi:hypothetical protein